MSRDPSSLRLVGRNTVPVSVLGLACGPFGDPIADASDAVLRETVAAARGAGMRHVDTAPFYGRDAMLRSLDDSLKRLGIARTDIACIRDVNAKGAGGALEARYRQSMAGAHPALASVVAGMRSALEVAESAEAMRHAIPVDLWLELRAEGPVDTAAPLPAE